MPTSSQAMILINCEADKKYNGLSTSKSQFSFRDPARMAVASVYNIDGLYSIPAGFVKDEEAISCLGRAPAQLFKYHKLPKGFRSILSFDPLTKTIQWRILGGDDTTTAGEAVTEVSGGENNIPAGAQRQRPFSANGRKSPRPIINKDIYERLLHLGFRGSGFEITESQIAESDDKTKLKSTTILSSIRKSALRKTVSEPQKLVPSARPNSRITEERKAEDSTPDVCRKVEDSGISPVVSDEDESTSLDEDLDPDGFYRILPSIYMRKDMPAPRPRSAIFSFRDNEVTTHMDVRELIQAQTGFKITGLQFDPLNLRVSRPDLRSRWIADFDSVDDLESFIRKALIIGKDKIIIYKYDDIAKREFSSFKYFKTIQDAKKSLRGSKSQKSTEKRNKVVRLRDARSYNVKDIVGKKR